MKYYTEELFRLLRDDDWDKREEGRRLWEERNQQYAVEFRKIKDIVLSKKSQSNYMKHYGFHDYTIKSISITCNSGKNVAITVEITNEKNGHVMKILYQKVQWWKCSAMDMFGWGGKRPWLVYMYDEFDIKGDNVVHRVLFNSENELEVVCKKIIIK